MTSRTSSSYAAFNDLRNYKIAQLTAGLTSLVVGLISLTSASDINHWVRSNLELLSSCPLFLTSAVAGVSVAGGVLCLSAAKSGVRAPFRGFLGTLAAVVVLFLSVITQQVWLVVTIAVLLLLGFSSAVFVLKASTRTPGPPFNTDAPVRPKKLLVLLVAALTLGAVAIGSSSSYILGSSALSLPKGVSNTGVVTVGSSDVKVAVLFGLGQPESKTMLSQVETHTKNLIKTGEAQVDYMFTIPQEFASAPVMKSAVVGVLCAAEQNEVDDTAYMRFVAESAKNVNASPLDWASTAKLPNQFRKCFYSGKYDDQASSMLARKKSEAMLLNQKPPALSLVGPDEKTAKLKELLVGSK